MRSFAKLLVLMTFCFCVVLIWSARPAASQQQQQQPPPRPQVNITRMFSGPDGQSHFETIDANLAAPVNANGRTGPIKVTGIQFRRTVPGNTLNWHNAPGPEYVITLSGQGELEVGGGQKFEQGPGQVVLAEDMTGKGHITRNAGTEDWVSIAILGADK